MLKKRIIPCLDIKDGRTVKGVHFENIRDAGDPVELAMRYVDEGADELVFLDITATIEKRKTLLALVDRIARTINIPFAVGGGIHSLDDAKAVMDAGADKISINSAALLKPHLIAQIAGEYGSQSVLLAMDVRYLQNQWMVFRSGGKVRTEWEATAWAMEGAALGAGELLLTSMDHDGAQNGYAIEITQQVAERVPIPVIASGGAGCKAHFSELFTRTGATAALAASIFHFGQVPIPGLKQFLNAQNIPVRL